MGNVGDIFEKRMKQLGIKKQVDASMIVAEAQENIEKALGKRGSDNVQVVSYNKGVLKIAVTNNAWASECRGHESKIKKPPVERVVYTFLKCEDR